MRKRDWLVMIVVLAPLLGSGSAFSKPGEPLWQTEAVTQATELTELTTTEVLVEPGKKLAITFTGRTSGEFTVEKNARIRLLNTTQVGSALIMQFFDQSGERLEEIKLPILTESAHEYGRVVYPPSEAKSLKLFLAPASSAEVAVENVRVTQELEGVEAESANPHPILNYGDLNAYGFGGEFFERPDGKTVWNTAFTGQTPNFPIQGGDSYELFGRGIGYGGKRSRIILQLFEEGTKRPFHTIRVGFSPEGVSATVILPEGAVSANFLGYYTIVEELKVIKAANPDPKK